VSEKRQGHFTGVSAEYYVASVLAYQQLHVGMVHEGGSTIDLLVSTPDGSRSTTVQVKGDRNARRIRKKDGVVTEYQWYCGKRVMEVHPNLIYAFVDLKEWQHGLPDIYVLRASHLRNHFRHLMDENPHKNWDKDMYRYHAKPRDIEPFFNDWSVLYEDLQLRW
jgi:hypothetical protein